VRAGASHESRGPLSVVLAGQSKSGTTAILYKVRNSIPGRVRILFEPTGYTPGGRSRPVLAKVVLTPQVDMSGFEGFGKKVFIVRDPRDNLISALLYGSFVTNIATDPERYARFVGLLRKKESDPGSVSVRELIELIEALYPHFPLFEYWKRVHKLALAFGAAHPDYFRLRYEDFVDGQLAELEAYLGFALTGAAEVGRRWRRVVRTKGYGQWRAWLTEQDVPFLRPLMSDYLRAYGYADDWTLAERSVIPPEHGSLYVERILAEKRRKDRLRRWFAWPLAVRRRLQK